MVMNEATSHDRTRAKTTTGSQTMTDLTDLPELSATELDVLKILWAAGRLSAREVHGDLGPRKGWAYSTTRTTLERMVEKGLLDKAAFHGLNLYRPLVSKPAGLARMVRDFAERVLELDAAPVVSLFARSEALSEDEVRELERLLELAPGEGEGEGR